MSLVFKGSLDNGNYQAMTAEEFHEHRQNEYYTKLMKRFEKVANNPALSEEVQQLMWIARCNLQVMISYRRLYTELKEKVKKNA